ncbi:CBS domain-containing protein [Alkalinema pantanalense CENA528]|uniref:CBS domain-containing protein n=1 Tax=Alkalinema pantanalense TaxID=1620705 RepID=UPI003D6E2BCC
MNSSFFLDWVPDLTEAIDTQPLTVTPETRLADAIALMSQAQSPPVMATIGNDTEQGDTNLTTLYVSKQSIRGSCVLVLQEQLLLGILTERDIVGFTAQAIDVQTMTVAEVMVHPVITLPQQYLQDVFAALFLLRRYRIRHLPIVDEQQHIIGVISHESIRQILRPANLLRFRRVADVMTQEVIQAPLNAPVLQLATLMAEHRVSCIVITQRDSEGRIQPLGIVTERDIVQFQAVQMNLLTTSAEFVMSTPLFLVKPEDSLWTAHKEMQKRRVGRLVVSWNWGFSLGIITQSSLLRVFDPIEMYRVIHNLQTMMEAQGYSRSPLESLDNRSGRPRESIQVINNPTVLLAQIQAAKQDLEALLQPSDLTLEAQRSRLLAILSILEQLKQSIDGNDPDL